MEPFPPLIANRLADVRDLCERTNVKRLAIFGSIVKGTFDSAKSDLDFVVEFLPMNQPGERGRCYLNLLVGLEDLFGRPVDLVERSAVKNPYFLQVLELTTQPLYDAA